MLTLRCTERLRSKIPGTLTGNDDGLRATLGDWHAHLVRLGNTPVVLAVSDVSLLAILLAGKDFENILYSFRDRVTLRLLRLGIPSHQMAKEETAARSIQIDRTNNRRVLGSMNDFVFQLRWRFREGLNLHCADRLEDELSETPMSAINYACAAEVTRASFGLPDRRSNSNQRDCPGQ